MPKPRNVIRPTALKTNVPEDLRAKLDLWLFSEIEGRVPHAAYSTFLAARIREFFEDSFLDLTPFGLEGQVRGSSKITEALASLLEKQKCSSETP